MSEWLNRTLELAQAGRTAYEIQLGQSYLVGRDFEGNPIPQDYAEARRWLERAHNKGAVTATYILGTMHENGHGVPNDTAAAMKLYTIAAERGSYFACLSLARMHAQGTAVASSRESAVAWYGKALSFADEVDDATGIEEARTFLREAESAAPRIR